MRSIYYQTLFPNYILHVLIREAHINTCEVQFIYKGTINNQLTHHHLGTVSGTDLGVLVFLLDGQPCRVFVFCILQCYVLSFTKGLKPNTTLNEFVCCIVSCEFVSFSCYTHYLKIPLQPNKPTPPSSIKSLCSELYQ